MGEIKVASHLMPSALLYCYNRKKLDSGVSALIQRCDEARQGGDQVAIIAIDAGIGSLPASVNRCEKAICRTYLADLAWTVGEFLKARNAYKEAQEIFHLSPAREDRHNEAATIYGQGLASHALGNTEEAQHCYNQALALFRAVEGFWAAEGNDRRSRDCTEVCSQIEVLRKLGMDSAIPSPPAGTLKPKVPPPPPPTITNIRPDRGAQAVPVDQPIEITFSEAMDPNRFGQEDYDISPPIVDKGVKWDVTFQQATIQHGGFAHSETYVVTIKSCQAQKTSAPLSPATWTFTTEDRLRPVICCTWPSDGDFDIPLEASLIVQCSRPIQDIQYAAKPKLPTERPPRRRWYDGKTIQIDFTGPLTPGENYEVTITKVQDDQGRILDVDQRASVPNPWRFRTMADRIARGQTPNVLDLVLAGLLLFALIGAGIVLLQFWLGWIAAVVFLLAWALAVPFLFSAWRKNHVVFPLSAGEEAIIDQAGQRRVMTGPMRPGRRWPVLEKLRAIVPVEPWSLRIANCQFTNNYGERIALAIDVRYRVFGSLKAFCAFLENCEDKAAGSKVYRAPELRTAWEKKLRQIIVSEVQKTLRGISKRDMEKDQGELELALVQLLSIKTYQWGIELQALRLAENGGRQ